MERTLHRDLVSHVGERALIAGWVDVRRDHGKLIFFDIRDRTGIVQVVVTPRAAGALAAAKDVRPQCVVEIEGEIKERPENMRAPGVLGSIEISVTDLRILSAAHELPFDMSAELNIDTHLDYLPLTLRKERTRDIFRMQAAIVEAYRASLRRQEFTEFIAPALVGGDAEGGAAAFKVDYYYDKIAFLATSPQFYKQIMVGPFERSFTIAKIFRAEKSATTRHLSELTQMDFEMGFIRDELDPMRVLETVIKDVVHTVERDHADILSRFSIDVPLIPSQFPILTLREAQKILGVAEDPDLEPEHERNICEWAKTEKKSDFVFITKFPTNKRAFYTYEEPAEAPYSRGFDLLFRGLEINSGAQRIHNYDMLIARMKERKLDPELFSFYLQAFKYGLPPHGGASTGLERFTARILGLANVKEAAAFPRDMNRIDLRLSQ